MEISRVLFRGPYTSWALGNLVIVYDGPNQATEWQKILLIFFPYLGIKVKISPALSKC